MVGFLFVVIMLMLSRPSKSLVLLVVDLFYFSGATRKCIVFANKCVLYEWVQTVMLSVHGMFLASFENRGLSVSPHKSCIESADVKLLCRD